MKHAPDKLWYVYIVECSDGTFYTGYTDNVDKRVAKHNKGRGAKYTRTRRPVKLRFKETHSTKSDAMRAEHWIKQLNRERKFLMILVYENRDKIAQLK